MIFQYHIWFTQQTEYKNPWRGLYFLVYYKLQQNYNKKIHVLLKCNEQQN
jgi:hypothetical protein